MEQMIIYFTDKNIKNIIRNLNKDTTLKIVTTNESVNGICCLFIFTQILESEMVKYEISFENIGENVMECTTDDSQKYILSPNSLGCSCYGEKGEDYDDNNGINNVLFPSYLLFTTSKSMNILNIKITWSMIIIFDFYRKILNNNLCQWCLELEDELNSAVKLLNSPNLFKSERISLPFITSTNLYSAIFYNFKFLCKKKLTHDKSIFCHLAREGISINTAKENFENVGGEVLGIIENIYGKNNILIYKETYGREIQPIEHFILYPF